MAAALTLVGCAGSDDGSDPSATTVVPAGRAIGIDFSRPGPYPVGFTWLETTDREVAVFYPADERSAAEAEPFGSYGTGDVLAGELARAVTARLVPEVRVDAALDAELHAEGPFPVVLSSHDAGSFALSASGQARHLASWGFVVAAPPHPERDLAAALFGQGVDADAEGSVDADVAALQATLDALHDESTSPDGILMNGLDLERVGAIGHGRGAGAAVALATDPAVDGWLGQAPEPPGPRLSPLERLVAPALAERLAALTPPAVSSLLVAAQPDAVVPTDDVWSLYSWLAPPKRLIVMAGGGHSVFVDQCAPVRAQGGLTQLVGAVPVAPELLARLEDGCGPGSLDPEAATALTRHLDVAQMRWSLGLDAHDASLQEDYLQATFPGVIAGYYAQTA
jgi:dienelactone hydrolase